MEAVRQIHTRIGEVEAVSRLYESKALIQPGSTPQPPFINAAVRVASHLEPEDVLVRALEIEQLMGRVRNGGQNRWQPRTIDIDILAIDNLVLSLPQLTIPHPELHRREFVLAPLRDIAPEWVHPLLHTSIEHMCGTIASCSTVLVGEVSNIELCPSAQSKVAGSSNPMDSGTLEVIS